MGLIAPRNLRVSDEWYTRFRVSWDPAPAKVNGYKITYMPEGEQIRVYLCCHWLHFPVNNKLRNISIFINYRY